ncbi:hypothetical protein JCM10213_001204 [Rhodosporidiobolus nylandii]
MPTRRLFPLLPLAASFLPFSAAAPLTATDLVESLLPASTNLSAVYGQQVNLRPFTLTLLANETHAQATLNISKGVDEVGWVALGLGTSMSNAAMLVMWPSSEDSSDWILSHRSAGGHAMPDFNPSITATTPGRWSLVPSLTSSFSSAKRSTVVTVTRTLDLPADQGVYPTSRLAFANLERKKAQKVIYAMSDNRPGLDTEGATLTMHTGRNFGATSGDLSQSFLRVEEPDATATSTAAEASSTGDHLATGVVSYDYLIAAHAVFAMLTWLLVAPVAVLLARLGRKWGSWFTWHSSVQTYLTGAFTIIVVALGAAAASKNGTAGHLDVHKTIGFVVLLFLVFQLAMGYVSHDTSFAPSRTSTRPLVRVLHIVAGIVLLALAWTNIGLGFREWKTRQVGMGVKAVYSLGVALFLLPFLYSLFTLTRLRMREGRSVFDTLFGLGRSSANPPAALGRTWAARLAPDTGATTFGAQGGAGHFEVKVAKESEDWGTPAGADLSAWNR